MFTKILLATDGSDYSKKATEHAIELAKRFNGTIDMVYVVDGKTAKADVLHSGNKFEIEKKRKERLQPIKELVVESGVEYTTHILHGEAGPTIVDFANKHQFDCVVIGSRGLNELQTFILGSVSHKVAKRANCPVLIVR